MIGLLSVPLFLLSLDSLPPIPEPSELPVQEPPLWTELVSSRILVSGYAGGRFGGVFQYFSERDSIFASYQNENDWCLTRLARLGARKTFAIGPCDLTPNLDAMGAFMGIYGTSIPEVPNPTDAVYHLGYGLSSSVYIPVAVFETGVSQHIWRINGSDHLEHQGNFTAYFDRLRLMPQVDLKVIEQEGNWRTEGKAWIHAGSFHAGIGSLLSIDDPSPEVDVTYRDVMSMARIRFKQGAVVQSFQSVVDPQLPLQYDFPPPQERVGWMVELTARRMFPIFTVMIGYRHRHDWDRCAVVYGYHLGLVEGVEEDAGFAVLSCSLTAGPIGIRNSMVAEYEALDPAIRFIPRYYVTNDLTIGYGALTSTIGLRYYTERPSYGPDLPAIALLESRIGYRIRLITLFLSVYNITGRSTQIYWGYLAQPRTVAAGLEFSRP